MTVNGYQDIRLRSFGGGMNTLNAPSEIDDNQFQYLQNFTSEGNKLVTMKGNKKVNDPAFVNPGVYKGQGMGSFGNTIFTVQNNALYVFDIVDGEVVNTNGASVALGITATSYNITTFRIGDIYVIVSDAAGVADLKIYRYHFDITWKLTVHTITGLTNKNFTCSSVYNDMILLGGIPSSPGVLFNSANMTVAAQTANPDSFINFSALPASSQVIGNGRNKIVGFASRQGVHYIFTNGNVWKITGYTLTTTTFVFNVELETNTGAVSQYAIINVEQDILYFDGQSVRRLAYENNNTNSFAIKDTNFSSRIQPTIDGMDKNQTSAVMMYSYPHVYLCMRGSNSTINDVCIVYNTINSIWTTTKGIFATSATSFIDKKQQALYFTPFTDGMYLIGTGYSNYENGVDSPIIAKAICKDFTLLDNIDFKRYCQVELNGVISNGLSVEVDLVVDEKVVQTRVIDGTNIYLTTAGTATSGYSQCGANGEEVNPMVSYAVRWEMFNDGQNFYFVIRQNGIGRFELHNCNLKIKKVNAYPMHY